MACNANACGTRCACGSCCARCTCRTCRACNAAACACGACCTCRACCAGSTRRPCGTCNACRTCDACGACYARCTCGASRPSYASDDYHITSGPAFRPAARIAGITVRVPWIAVRTAAVLVLPAAGMTGISILSACVTAAAVSRISGHRFTAESAVPAAAAAIIPVSVGISIHTHSPLFLSFSVFILYYVRRPKLCPFSPVNKKRERNVSSL